ncbi:MAG: hypothetical protein H6Q04_1726, partial [Acidobacteria bacterium]|nr:hypothetical protein [Acidobacteriota bacterium]
MLKHTYVYIAIAGEDKILVCTLDDATGALELRHDIPV